ncbi:sensor histidine kinase [Streptomyces sp. NPDC003300]|uniref:sensor histidine kinase n=1 Tax=unclassified Streptomyces TaxID=2593676 RepID=UPI00339DEB5F
MISPARNFSHPALFYRGAREYLEGTVPFVRDGLAAGEPVAVAAPPVGLGLLRTALGSDAGAVRFIDMTTVGRNPGRIIPAVLRAFCDAQPPGPVRIIGEPIWPGRTALEYPACVQHEALINTAFAGRQVTILCPYDAAGLAPDVLDDAHATHPVVIEAGRERPSDRYAPDHAVASGNTPLPEPRDAASFAFDDQRLRDARRFAVRLAGGFGLTGARLDDLALAVSELITNSVLHGGGSGTIRLWTENDQVVCEVRDGGRLSDPMAGRRLPPNGRPGGRGLLMVNHIADLVRVHAAPDGTAIRCYLGGAPVPAGAAD